ncbi:Cgl0159 family (beta/alpha)8-fold protein [Streptosporangium sandarakinum]|uniref:Cgl0159 family (beta/alpha)8-fold protein n=1 Tax=Streptosporangium sandarakinum TaxID=1260955 RepID=UPI003D94C258
MQWAQGAGGDSMAMADRGALLDRLCVALERPGVTGVMGTADILEDLLLLGVLDGKSVFGSMNRTGLAGSTFEIDDRFTAYDAETIASMGFDGGRTLTRIALEDAATPSGLENTARAVNELNDRKLIAMVEPFISRWSNGKICNDLSPEAVIRGRAWRVRAALGGAVARRFVHGGFLTADRSTVAGRGGLGPSQAVSQVRQP